VGSAFLAQDARRRCSCCSARSSVASMGNGSPRGSHKPWGIPGSLVEPRWCGLDIFPWDGTGRTIRDANGDSRAHNDLPLRDTCSSSNSLRRTKGLCKRQLKTNSPPQRGRGHSRLDSATNRGPSNLLPVAFSTIAHSGMQHGRCRCEDCAAIDGRVS